jgi:hypothetical protein
MVGRPSGRLSPAGLGLRHPTGHESGYLRPRYATGSADANGAKLARP